MTTITNKTKKPLTLSLPGGKKLRLGPFKSGVVNPKQVDHPPIQKLVESGEIEISEDGKSSATSKKSGGKGIGPSQGGGGFGGGVRHTGDR